MKVTTFRPVLGVMRHIHPRNSHKFSKYTRFYTHRIINNPQEEDVNKLEQEIFNTPNSTEKKVEYQKNLSENHQQDAKVSPQQVSEEHFKEAILAESLNFVNDLGWSTEAIAHVCKSVNIKQTSHK